MKKVYPTTIMLVLMILATSYFVSHLDQQKPTRYSLRFSPETMQVYRYKIAYKSTTDIKTSAHSKGLIQLPPSNTSDLDAELSFYFEQRGDHEPLTAIATLKTISSQGDLAIAPTQVHFSFQIDHFGHIDSLMFNQQAFTSHSFLIAAILSPFNLQLPDREKTALESWNCSEDVLGDKIPCQQKITSWQENAAILVRTFQASYPLYAEGDTTYRLMSHSAIPKSIRLKRHQQQNNIQNLDLHTNLEYSAELLDTKPLTSTELHAIKAELDANPLSEKDHLNLERYQKYLDMRVYKNELGTISPQDLIVMVEQASPDDIRANMTIYTRLKALFAVYPQHISAFKSFLLDYDLEDERFSMVATALTAIGSPEAQAMLRDVIESLADEERIKRLIPNLSFMDYPNEQSEALIDSLSSSANEQIRTTAELALGTMAHMLRDDDHERSEQIIKRFSETLQDTDPNQSREITHLIDVIGNVGIDEQLAILKPYTRSPNPNIRATASFALRHIASSEAKSELLTIIANDRDNFVREHASDSLTYTKIYSENITSIKQLLYTEKNLKVLKALIRSLANYAHKDPFALQVITEFYQQCAHPDLCPYVGGLLKSFTN